MFAIVCRNRAPKTYPVKLYLKNTDQTKASPVRLRVWINGKPYHYSIGESVFPDMWDFQKQRCKVGKKFPMSGNINIKLDWIVNQAQIVKTQMDTPDAPLTWQQFKDALDQRLNRNIQTGAMFWQYVDEWIESKINTRPELIKGVKRNSILTSYRQTYNLLKAYESTGRLDFEVFDIKFYNNFVKYCQKTKGFSVNNTGKHIKVLKTWLNAATLDGVNTNLQFKRFRVLNERTEEVYLTPPEIDEFINVTGLTPTEELIRDLFVFACFTGLRFIDYQQVKKGNIRGKPESLFLYQSKTGHPVIVPLRPECIRVLHRYGGELPKAPENQTMNRVLKRIAGCTGIDKIKIDKIKTHTARRSFATNLYMEGFPAHDIMKITGHKTEKAFLLYIRTSPTDAANRLREFWDL